MGQINDIVMYSASTCPHCKRAKRWLIDNGIPFTNFDVLEDLDARDQMINISGQMGVPVIVIGDNVVVGFNQPLLKEKLGI